MPYSVGLQMTSPEAAEMAALRVRQERWLQRWSAVGALTVASAVHENMSPAEFWRHESQYVTRIRAHVLEILLSLQGSKGTVLEYGIGAAHLSGDVRKSETEKNIEPGDIAALAALLGFSFFGIDFAASAVEVARKNIHQSFSRRGLGCDPEQLVRCMPAHELLAGTVLEPSSVALILASRFLIHVPEVELRMIIAAWGNLLQPGGKIVIAHPDPERNERYKKNKIKNQFTTIWSLQDILSFAEDCGFGLKVESEVFFPYLEETYALWTLSPPY